MTARHCRTNASDRLLPTPDLPHKRGARGPQAPNGALAPEAANSSSSTRCRPPREAHTPRSHHRTANTTRPTSHGTIQEGPAVSVRTFPPQPGWPVALLPSRTTYSDAVAPSLAPCCAADHRPRPRSHPEVSATASTTCESLLAEERRARNQIGTGTLAGSTACLSSRARATESVFDDPAAYRILPVRHKPRRPTIPAACRGRPRLPHARAAPAAYGRRRSRRAARVLRRGSGRRPRQGRARASGSTSLSAKAWELQGAAARGSPPTSRRLSWSGPIRSSPPARARCQGPRSTCRFRPYPREQPRRRSPCWWRQSPWIDTPHQTKPYGHRGRQEA